MNVKPSLVAALTAVGLWGMLQACDRTIPPPETAQSPPPTEITVSDFDREQADRFTDTAKLLAGIEVDSSSKLADIQERATWREHHRFLDNSWSQLEEQQLAKVRAWADTQLSNINTVPRDVFYPFSGPDFLYAHTFFPKGKQYVLIGLEPVGTIPDLETLSEYQQNTKLLEVKNSLYAILQWSFFRTKDMQVDLQQQGVLPIIFFFLARTNNRILDVSYIELNENARIQSADDKNSADSEETSAGDTSKDATETASADASEEEADENQSSEGEEGAEEDVTGETEDEKNAIPGVKISFVSEGKTKVQTLYYFSTDLSDEGMEKTPQFAKFVQTLDRPVTYLKAASYLMHYDYFSQIRDLILSKTESLLQDDSGIMVRDFDEDQWKLSFYGNYTPPRAPFNQQEYQPDLTEIYRTTEEIPSLDFGIGYNFGPNESNLMLAIERKGSDAPSQSEEEEEIDTSSN